MMNRRSVVTRRSFFKTTAKIGILAAAPAFVPGRVLGKDGAVAASERITLGGIGIRNRGGYDLGFFMDEPVVQFVAVCDVRRDCREKVKARAEAKYGPGVATYRDFRELLARPDIDAVLIATGDRWHATASIMAAKAGKDIYSEKPCAITIDQAFKLRDALRRYGRVFQAGTHRRNVAHVRWAVDLAQSGKLGKLHTVHASMYRLGENHNWLPAEPEPSKDEIDWDLWLGPAPWRPYNKAYVDGAWRGYFDFDSGATLLDWGAHTVDLCQWANQADGTTPVQFELTGPNEITGRYANGVKLVLREANWVGLGMCPIRFEGDEGWVETGDTGKVDIYPESLRATLPLPDADDGRDSERTSYGPGISPRNHVRDFLRCVKTRATPATGPETTCSTHVTCHAAYLAWLLNRPLTFDPVKGEFVGDDEANRRRSRPQREPWRI